jgi:hypothetical protein
MTRRLLAIGALFGVLAIACGKVVPPVRLQTEPAAPVRAESTAAGNSETTEGAGTSAAEEAGEEEQQP